MQNLHIDTTLQNGKYKIIRTLGQGGFGITYLAEQTMLERKVAIKEFFMKEFCERDEPTGHVSLGTEGCRETVNRFREKFLKEARNIAKLNHPNIVRIIDVFEENGTAYYVMEYCKNGSLAGKVKEQGNMSEPVATHYIIQVAEALDYIHQRKMNHLDVKPANIILNERDDAVLIDFGLSKRYNAGGQQTSTTPVGISEGYAPMEQYKQGGVGEFSPETDIYALGATFFKLLTGVTPPSASDVNEEGVPIDDLKAKSVSQKAINVICKAMESRKRDRMKNVCLFIDELQGESPSATQSDGESTMLTPDNQRAEDERKRKEAKAKDETEHKAKDEAERKASERAERKAKEEEEAKKKESHKDYSKMWLWIVIGAIVVVGVVIGINNSGNTSTGNDPSTTTADNDSLTTTADNASSTPTANKASYSNGTLSVNGVTYKMVPVSGGTFIMGATSEMENPRNDEKPTHQVTLRSFSIGQTEVTQALWKAVMGSNPSLFQGDNLPIEQVSWNECQTFISKLNSLTEKHFRLPTEAEWEFAARGGKNSSHYQYSGSNNLGDVAWYGSSSGYKTHPVATKHANELGIYDMSGNVLEWCCDWKGDYSSDYQIDPFCCRGTYRVLRGGGWNDVEWCCRSSFRRSDSPDYRYSDLGFRLCLSK